MANRWKGNFVIAAGVTSDGTNYLGQANGSWSLNNQLQQKRSNSWATGIQKPGAPIIGNPTAGDKEVSVAFTPNSFTGGGTLSFTATSFPGGLTATGTSSPLIVKGLTNGTSYTFTVTATNSHGYTSVDSAASAAAIPAANFIIIARRYDISLFKWDAGFSTQYTNLVSAGDLNWQIRDNMTISLSSNNKWLYTPNSNGNGSQYFKIDNGLASKVEITGLASAGHLQPVSNQVVVGTGTAGAIAVWSANTNSETTPASAWYTKSGQYQGPGCFSQNGNFYIYRTQQDVITCMDMPYGNNISTTAETVSWTMAKTHQKGNTLFVGIDAWPFNTTTGVIGTKYASPSGVSLDYPYPVIIGASNDGSRVIISKSTDGSTDTASAMFKYFAFSNGWGTLLSNPSPLSTMVCTRFGQSNDGKLAVLSHAYSSNVGSCVSVYDWSNGFGTRYANAGLVTGNTPYCTIFSF
jgi:hypothetical protein